MAQASTTLASRSAAARADTVSSDNDATAKLLLRVALGLLILLHGLAKLGSGPGYIVDLVSKTGLPGGLGYLVYVGEIVAPLLLIAGLWTRAAALVVAINMVDAILLVHTSQFFTLGKSGGWALELQGMFLLVAVAVAMLGAGRWSLGGVSGRWN
jgi:putative oxidoreductase